MVESGLDFGKPTSNQWAGGQIELKIVNRVTLDLPEAANNRSNVCIRNMIEMSSRVLLLRSSEGVFMNDDLLSREKDAPES